MDDLYSNFGDIIGQIGRRGVVINTAFINSLSIEKVSFQSGELPRADVELPVSNPERLSFFSQKSRYNI